MYSPSPRVKFLTIKSHFIGYDFLYSLYEKGKKVLYVPSPEELQKDKKKQKKQGKTITSIGDLQFTTFHSVWDDGSCGKTLYIASGKVIPKDFDINNVEKDAYLAISENGGMTEAIWNKVIQFSRKQI